MKKFYLKICLGILLVMSVLLFFLKRKEPIRETPQITEKETETVTAVSTELPEPQYTMVIDAGHGGVDPGKVGVNDVLEKDINLAVAQKLKVCMEKENIRVVMTRESDTGLYEETDTNKKRTDMAKRCQMIKEAEAVLTVSIHQNSFTDESVSGPQVFYYEGSKEGERAAVCLQEVLNTYLEIAEPRETKANTSYYMLKKSSVPAVIVECGFLSNPTEAEKLADAVYQQKIAEALTRGILEFLKGDSSS